MPMEMDTISIFTMFWVPSSLGTLILIALLIQSWIASSKKDISGSQLNLSLLGVVAVLQLGFPLYDVYHAASVAGMGCLEFLIESVWISFWHLSVSSLLLFIGFAVLIVHNHQRGLLKKYLPVTASFMLLFIYSVFLLIAGIK